MPKKIRADRVKVALDNIGNWRNAVHAQGSTHLFPLLALLERGAGALDGQPTLMNETPHEFDFWDKYFRLRDSDPAKPYFNPVTLRRAEAGFPHSNSATIRKNTFANKWHAASRHDEGGDEKWSLSENYADIFRDKVLRKGGQITRAPVTDLAVLMFRDVEFEIAADATALEKLFRERFRQRGPDYEKLFEFRPENTENIFAADDTSQDYEAAIKSTLIDDIRTASAIPSPSLTSETMDLDDPILIQVQKLLEIGTSGIIFSGIPGTGKSYYAKRVARHLVKDPAADIFRVQFHPSYGYEDFVEGYRPEETAASGYQIVDKTFILACKRALDIRAENRLVVVIVDELNRGDPARVFGELLTYIERNYRGEEFTLPFSGKSFSIPENLVLIATMNPYDRSISQIDAAFIRRFDHVEISPSREVAQQLLEEGDGFSEDEVDAIGAWFETVQNLVPFGLGHSFFGDIKSIENLRLVWKYRMFPAITHAIELDTGAMDNVTQSFDALMRRLDGTDPDA